jgi:hypothetical protein
LVTTVAAYDEETLGEILSAFPPAPETWVEAAYDIPQRQQGIEQIVERADADEDYRRRVIADPETALEEADVVAHSETIEILRRRLDADK